LTAIESAASVTQERSAYLIPAGFAQDGALQKQSRILKRHARALEP
jgi:hypothetical protein